MKRFTAIIITVLLALVIALAALAFSWHVKSKSFSAGYAKLQVGDTKQIVVQVLGQPEEIENCYDSGSKEDLTKRCVETYWYKSFLERWGLSFDRDGKVIDKTYNVSY